jgi:tetratricopeptide (TPR) repeat protein/DNA-binding CsgD family transcriptional regulator
MRPLMNAAGFCAPVSGLFIALGCFSVFAFSAPLAAQPFDTFRMRALSNRSLDIMYSLPDSSLLYAQQALALAQEHGYERGAAKILVNIGNLHYLQGMLFEAKGYLMQAQEINLRVGDAQSQAAGYNSLAIIAKRLNHYPEALQYYRDALRLMEESGNEQDASYTLFNIGQLYLAQSANEDARKHFLASLELGLRLADTANISANYTALGDLALEEGRFGEAKEYYYKALIVNEKASDHFRQASLLAHLGELAYEEKHYADSEDYLRQALQIYAQLNNEPRKFPVYAQLCRTCLALGKLSEALQHAQRAFQLADSLALPAERVQGASLLFEALSSVGRWEEAARIGLLALQYQDTLFNAERRREAEEMRIRYETEKKEQEITVLQQQNRDRQRVNQLLALVLLLIVSGGVLTLWHQFQTHRRRKQLLLAENEVLKANEALAALNLRQAEAALSLQEERLQEIVRSLEDKSRLIESLKEELSHIAPQPERASLSREKIRALLQQKILTEDDWELFLHKFDQLFPQYVERLRERYPQLSQAELRLWLLTKLNLSGKAMSNLLGISDHSVRISRYRLKKKLSLGRQENLSTFISAAHF